MLPYSVTKRTTVLRTDCHRTGPEGRVGTDVRILRVSATHALMGRLSRRSEILSVGDWLSLCGTTSSLGLRCEGFVDSAGSFGLVTGACLGLTVNLEADFAVLPLWLVFVTSLRVGVSVTGPGVGWDSVGGVALTTRPPRTTWFQSDPRLSCSAEVPAPNGIPNRALKHLLVSAVSLFFALFKAIFRIQYFPSSRKHVRVFSIPKPGEDPAPPFVLSAHKSARHDWQAFRLDPTHQDSRELRGRWVLRNEQFGCWPKKSTALQLTHLVERVSKNFGEKWLTGAVCLDVA